MPHIAIATKKTPRLAVEEPQRMTPKPAVKKKLCLTELENQRTALDRSNAMLEMDMSGNILAANDTFLRLFGYKLEDIIGQHHRMLLPKDKQHSRKYKEFWARLKKGEYHVGEFQRKRANGDIIWVQGSYNPVFDKDSNLVKILKITTDVTLEKKEREELSRKEILLNMAQTLAGLGTFVMDFKSKTWTGSNQLNLIFGIGPDYDKTIEGFKSLFHPDWQKSLHDYFWKEVVAQKTIIDKEFKIVRPDDKEERWVLSRGTVTMDDSGCPAGICGTIMDITEQKNIVEALRENDKLLNEAQIIARLGTYIYELGPDRWTSSEMMDNIFGIGPDFPRTLAAWTSIIAPEWQDIINEYFTKEVIGNKAAFDKIYKIIRQSDNAERWVHGKGVLKFDENGNVVRLIGTIMDITDRKLAEDMSLKLSHAIEQSPTSIVITDPAGNIEYVNPKFTNITGYTREEVMGKNPRVLKSGYTTNQEYKKLWAQLSSGQEWRGEFLNKKKNGEVFWELAVIAPVINDKGEIINFIAVKEDITERKRAEETIASLNSNLEEKVKERTAELQEANTALEAFSYSASHDLRAPLRSIMGFSGIIQNEYAQSFNTGLREAFEYIDHEAKRMNDIITDMLALARSGKETLRISEVDFTLLFAQVWEDLKISQPNHALIEFGTLPICPADASMMQQVIVNLLGNAIKYSSKREHPLIMVSCEEVHGDYIFSIRDNGAGFDMKMYSKLFSAFHRLHGLSEFEGTGIGLSLVKRIIEKHGGHVWAEGMTDQGATFHFSLRKPKPCNE